MTWDIPAEYENFLKQNLRSKHSSNENSYTVCYTDDKVPYYVNEFTRQVSWEKPAGFVEQKNAEKNVRKSKKAKTSNTVDGDHRNGHKKKSKKHEKTTKKYPFVGDDDLDHV